jgi:hypothetical protein
MLLLVASAWLAASTEPAVAPTTTPPPTAKPRRVCHVEEAVIGSIATKRVCVTVQQPAASSVPKPAREAERDKPLQSGSAGSGERN